MINALDLAHYAAWELYPSILNYRYCFPGGGSVNDRDVVVVVIVSIEEEERQLFFEDVPYDCKSSLSLPSMLT